MCARGGGGLLRERMALASQLWAAGLKAEFLPQASDLSRVSRLPLHHPRQLTYEVCKTWAFRQYCHVWRANFVSDAI